MREHCLPTDPKMPNPSLRLILIMHQKERLLEDLGKALEELQRMTQFLEILRHLAEVGDSHPDQFAQARWAALLIQQALVVNELAVDILQVWPERLDPQDLPL